MGTPSRLTHGLATQPKASLYGDLPYPDPFNTGTTAGKGVFLYTSDFTDSGSTVNYTVTGTSSTFALEAGTGGYAVLTPGGATTASVMYRTAPNFQFISGNSFWFNQRVIPGLFATTGTYAFGLQFGAAVTDGIWFTKPASSTNINLVSTVASTATTLATAITTHTVGTLAAGATTALSTTVTCTSTAGVVAGQYIYGTGIPLNAQVVTVVNATTLTISIPATATGSALTLIYASAVDVGFYYNGTDLLVYVNDALVSRISNPTIGPLNTNTITSVSLTPFMSCTPTATDLLHTDYVLAAQELTR